MSVWTLSQLAKELDLEFRGDPDLEITGLATLSQAEQGQLAFLANTKYASQLEHCQASAIIVADDVAHQCPRAVLIASNPYLAYARASRLFDTAPSAKMGIHASAIIDDSALIGDRVSIGPHCVIAAGAQIADDAVIGPGSVVGAHSVVGARSRLHANVTLYHDVTIGVECIFHSGVVLGADGFGFAPDAQSSERKWCKISQLGGVCIGDHVEVGANTTIDRGALDDTVIGNGVILDNQIQIAHNVQIGDFSAIAGCTGIAGSTKIGRNCTIAGDVGIAGHLDICDNVHITMRSDVTRSISKPGSYSSGTAMSTTAQWRKNAARFRQLDAMARTLQKLERQLS